MAMETGRLKEAHALETIGTALYALRKRICAVQDAHMKAVTENLRRE